MLKELGSTLHTTQQTAQIACMRTVTHGQASVTTVCAYILLRLIALNVLEVATCWLGRTCMHHSTSEWHPGML